MIIRGKAIISNVAHWKSCANYFVLLRKIITSNELNMGFLSVSIVDCFFEQSTGGRNARKGYLSQGFRNIAWISLFEAYERVGNLSFRPRPERASKRILLM